MSSFLYPSLAPQESAGDQEPRVFDAALLLELANTVRGTWSDAVAFDCQSVAGNRGALHQAAALVVACATSGGRVLVMGNGGSACDAERLVRLLQPLVAARTLLDPAVFSAIANDVGAARVFSRQVETFASSRDLVVVFSTSGTSPNVIEAVGAAKRAGASTVAFAGYGGATLATTADVDVCISVDSTSVHRIQEAQGALCDALVVLVHAGLVDAGLVDAGLDPADRT